MAAENRKPAPEIIEKLLTASSSFSFVQAVRLLLRHLAGRENNETLPADLLKNHIRIRPELSLRFPGTDITRIEPIRDDPDMYRITATFLGLYGASSPLPAFYTEDLIEERNDGGSIRRDFIDIINYSIYPVFFRLWSKYRLFYRICEERDESAIQMIYCLLGLENKHLRDRLANTEKYFRYSGLALQFPRSAEGLTAIVEDCFNLTRRVIIDQCVPRKIAVPEDQRCRLGVFGCTLGLDAVVGHEIGDISGKFRMRVTRVDPDTLHAFLPDRQSFRELRQMTAFYVNQPFEWDLALELDGRDIETTRPGHDRWSRLGWNTWLVSDHQRPERVRAVFSTH